MRTIPFKEVLYAVARKNSIDPESGNFSEKEAFAFGVFIDQWIRRTYPGADWPEWTTISEFTPSNHIIPWDTIAFIPGFAGGLSIRIGRVFKAYLVDPRTTSAPVGTDHTLLDTGIHCGFEHGRSVWLKYMPPPPRFTAEKWRPDETYKKDDIRYSSTTGECYRSKVSGNLGHDPATTFSPAPHVNVETDPIQLRTEITNPVSIGNPGIPQTNQVIGVFFAVDVNNNDVPNPPPNNSRFFVEVVDSDGGLLGNATVIGDGVSTLDLIVTDLSNQLISALAGFTITADTASFSIEIAAPSNFRVNQAFWGLFTQPNANVPVKQEQSFIPLVPPVQQEFQTVTAWVTEDQVIPDAVYTLTFIDSGGGIHEVNYTALTSDNADQILVALVSAVQSQGAAGDPFFGGIISSIDTVSNSASFSTFDQTSLNAEMLLPGSPWWELQSMPIDLSEMIIRGASADLMKEWGQMQAGDAEEQMVPTEGQVASSKYASQQTPPLTGQQ